MSAWPPLPPLSVGEFAPDFTAATPANPNYHFNTCPGRYVLLGFLPRDRQARADALAAFEPHRPRFDDANLTAFFVTGDPETIATARDRVPGQRWFFDPEGEVGRLYGALDAKGGEHPFWLLLDPALRIIDKAPVAEAERLFARLADLRPAGDYASVPLVAPVLVAPRIFEPELCKRLMAYYDERGGELSGVMRDIGGRTVGVLDPMKKRRDVRLADPGLRNAVNMRLGTRLIPMIERVYRWRATRIERYLVACYDADEGGYFRAHRDDETHGTAHRRFAVSINLNAEQFEGGDLRFPEFGDRTYRPPTGGAVVFCCSLQHEATPVTKGRRYAFLPFLYDEAGAEIRERNLALLGEAPAPAGEAR